MRFYDTNALLLLGEDLFNKDTDFYISSITLEELENIKSSANKDPDIKYQARKVVHELDKHYGEYEVVIYQDYMALRDAYMTPDLKIIACALSLKNPDLIFVSNDICCKLIAKQYFFDNVESVEEEPNDYSGYREIIATDDELNAFYTDETKNIFNLNIGEYLLLKDAEGKIIDLRCWSGEKYRRLKYGSFDSVHFGKVVPYNNDIYQKMAFDSLSNNTVTMLRGPAGSGKSVMSMAYLFNLLEHNAIDKIVIFCNPVAVKGAAKLGFYPGDKNDKLLDSQIGNILSTKIGDRIEVDKLLEEGKIVLIPMSDARGVDLSANCAVYATEAQNMDKNLMKLLLQRVGDGVKVIIDGDYTTQLDMTEYEGSNNGMRRLSEVFRGADGYGEIELKQIYRSNVARLAEMM